MRSPFGQVLKAIRENEPRAISLGYDVDRYKLPAFVVSASLPGLAGLPKTVVLGFAALTNVHWSLSCEVILMTLLGGLGTFAGPVVGAFTIIGVIFVLCVIASRRSNVGELTAWQQRQKVGQALFFIAAEPRPTRWRVRPLGQDP